MDYAKGIDVSSRQGQPDWDKVKAAGISFAFIKVSEGTGYVNTALAGQWQGAAGKVLRGPYHFFRWDCDPVAQANFFVAEMGRDRGEIPPVVDVEGPGDGAGPMNYNAAQAVRNLRAFIDRVKALTGKGVIIYTYPSVWVGTLGNPTSFTDCSLWIANYGVQSPTVPGGWPKWTFWQYSDHGVVDGVGLVDIDYFAGTADDLRAWCGLSTPDSYTFPQTGMTVSNAFLAEWKSLGLTTAGYPLSLPYLENVPGLGPVTFQDFENLILQQEPGKEVHVGAGIRKYKYDKQ